MKNRDWIALAAGAVLLLAASFCAGRLTAPRQPMEARPKSILHAHFSPKGGCEAEAVRVIGEAKKHIYVQAYAFTSQPIAQALVDAHKRGVKVEVCADEAFSHHSRSLTGFLADHGVGVWLDGQHPIAHSKTIVVDGHTVITGSFNFTESAEARNLENMWTIEDRDAAAKLEQNFSEHQGHSVRQLVVKQ